MKLPTLYGRSDSGKIKQWSVSVIRLGDGTSYINVEHGYEDGKKQVDQRCVSEGKNIGKANETTPYEQALSEAQSAWNKKRDEGYVEDKGAIPANDAGMFLPMLAQPYDKHSKKILFPCYVQPKLDGMRALARKVDGVVTMWSRKGKVISIPDKIIEELQGFLREGESTDGELYHHGWTFQRLISATKKKSSDTDLLQYHIYDNPHATKTFRQRFIEGNAERSSTDRIQFVPTYMALNANELRAFESQFVGDGYEGLMARNGASLYDYKNRSFDLQKVKQFKDAEFRIVGGKDGQGREEGLIIFQCDNGKGNLFDVRPRGSHEERAQMFKNLDDFIGKELTVRFFEYSEDGVPRFPVGIVVRDYE
jgi:DNA ligase-1